MQKKLKKVGVALGLLAVAGAASAQAAPTVDLSAVTSAIALAVTAIGTIGIAVLGVRAAVATYTWVRQAIK
ncbi:MAG: phage coat protein [Rhizobium sp.]|nr:MAG: phage coat protein [Rhizobium sp.]